MRFSILFSALAMFASVSGHDLSSRTTTPRAVGLDQRQVVGLTLCTELPLDIAIPIQIFGEPINIGLTESLCLCLDNGLITPSSLDSLTADITNNLDIDLDILGIQLNILVPLVVDALVTLVGSQPAPAEPCDYPVGAIPNSCAACTFDCPLSAPTLCNGQCISGVCPSSLPQTRRARSTNPDLLCPAGLTACRISSGVASAWGKVECLDTLKSVDTCGGCSNPLPGKKQGVDCSAIENTNSVSCVAGICKIGSCSEGFALVRGACVAI